ncbi:FAD/NAD(P)-binding domain-containing protein [Gymnopus androsaceus JB14]|uniref:L-ornithine N(5)-monooxygenase [NAD(P)H] n=1 Tax=Gymnopus androsaceus JB14 TaxID=1447944 RepID=A0A6A4HTM3_9AGAR|nr:FAD/NAD(P)-binding domain-containing protein [Gymnopus androsaceus JB14]
MLLLLVQDIREFIVLHRFRFLGLNVKVYEAGSDFGGTWFYNRFPGIHADSGSAIYQWDLEELWKDWTWNQKFPSGDEIQSYLNYVEEKLDLKRDIYFNNRVDSAKWDESSRLWSISTSSGLFIRTQFLILCTGALSKPFIPDIKGLSTFRGPCHHTSRWPQEKFELEGKRAAVIGTGPSGVTVIEQLAPRVQHLKVFQRTPNMALPMRQSHFSRQDQDDMKKSGLYSHIFRRLPQTFGGFLFDFQPMPLASATVEARRLLWESLWGLGGFRFWLENYPDIFSDKAANDEAYAFWRSKVTERVRDPALQENLAPAVPPHPFGLKRPSLEQTYFDIYNRDNVSLVDIKESPIEEIVPEGLRTRDALHYFDVLILATGFDALTGSIVDIDIRGSNNVSVHDKWKSGVYSNLGMTTSGFSEPVLH